MQSRGSKSAAAPAKNVDAPLKNPKRKKKQSENETIAGTGSGKSSNKKKGRKGKSKGKGMKNGAEMGVVSVKVSDGTTGTRSSSSANRDKETEEDSKTLKKKGRKGNSKGKDIKDGAQKWVWRKVSDGTTATRSSSSVNGAKETEVDSKRLNAGVGADGPKCDFERQVIRFFRDHRADEDKNNATHSLMCGSAKLPFVKGFSGNAIGLPGKLCFDTPEKRELLHKLIVKLYMRNPMETLPLVEFGARQGAPESTGSNLFYFCEDVDVLLSENCDPVLRPAEAKSEAVANRIAQLEQELLDDLLPYRVESLGAIWEEDGFGTHQRKRRTKLLIFSSSGYAMRYNRFKISLHFMWPELIVDENGGERIRERLLADLEHVKDDGIERIRKLYLEHENAEQSSFEEVFDRATVRGASLRMTYCDKFVRKDTNGEEKNCLEGRCKKPLSVVDIDFFNRRSMLKCQPADHYTPLQWLEKARTGAPHSKKQPNPRSASASGPTGGRQLGAAAHARENASASAGGNEFVFDSLMTPDDMSPNLHKGRNEDTEKVFLTSFLPQDRLLGFVLFVDGSHDRFLNKVAVGVSLQYGLFTRKDDDNIVVAQSAHKCFEGGFLFKGDEFEGDHEAAAATVGLIVVQEYVKKLRKQWKDQAALLEHCLRQGHMCVAADSRVPMNAIENKTKKLSIKQRDLLQQEYGKAKADIGSCETHLWWIRRQYNKDADRLARNALQGKPTKELPEKYYELIRESLR
eukprot:g1214.t1